MKCTRLSAAAVVAVVATALTPISPPSVAAGNCWNRKPVERGFARKINHARSRQGIRKLKYDPQLSKVARKHATEMDRRNSLYHTPSSKLRRRVTNWSILGENVGVGGSVKSLHRAFMRSAPHRHNILDRNYRYIGVGRRRDGGTIWVTVIFEATRNPGTRLNMPC